MKYCYEKIRIDEMAKAPFHCELNPIELVWAQVKYYVAIRNKTFKKSDIEKLIEGAFESTSEKNWKIYVSHVVSIENEMWRAGKWQNVIESFVIQLGESSSTDMTDEDMSDGWYTIAVVR